MKKVFLVFIFSPCIIHFAFSQNPLLKMWDYTYGGDSTDGLNAWLPQPSRNYLLQSSDGGYLMGSYSLSQVSGEKTEPSWNNSYDYWVVKLDSLGLKEWDKDFGGSSRDELISMSLTNDGGYLLGGNSLSDISGHKTQARWGDYDFWIVKIDSLGNIQWDRDFGGSLADELHAIQYTSDKGFILGGRSLSGVSGNKTQPGWGLYDYWIIKIDSMGIIQWDRRFGGTMSDELHSILVTPDGGYLLVGNSVSGANGDKSQPSWGSSDYWVVKIDSLGNKQWDRRYGGTAIDLCWSATVTKDGGYLLGGTSNSGISGDKAVSTYNGSMDYWIVKIDSTGIMQWDRGFGGNANEDEFGRIFQTQDNGYLICGTSYSNISGDKSQNNLAQEQSWIVKLDSNGYKVWDRTLLNGYNETCDALQNNEGCYVFANFNNGGIAGDKSQPCRGNTDYWIIKFCDSTSIPLTASFTTDQNICPGTCCSFLNLSINATSYQWFFQGANPNASTDFSPVNICYPIPGSYDVQLISTNANGSDTLLLTNYITVFPSPPAQSISQSADTLFAVAGSNSYQWYFNSNLISGATDYFYIAPSSGDYNVVVTDTNGCEVEAVINNVLAGFSPLAFGEGSGVRLYPNPAETELKISNAELNMDAVEIKIYNLIGVLTDQFHITKVRSEIVVGISEFSSGLYYIEISGGEKTLRSKFVKQ